MPKNVRAERSVSIWMPVPEIPGPSDSRPCDVVVIGAGMAGLSIAYEALARGRQVTVLDRGAIASGMTARTTAHPASALDDFCQEFISRCGEDEAGSAGDFIAENVTAVKSMAEYLGGPLLPSEDALGPGEGGLIKGGLQPVAAYRAEDGSANRSHVAVHFSCFECGWDCPCHGSHFALDGEATNAPATQPLKSPD